MQRSQPLQQSPCEDLVFVLQNEDRVEELDAQHAVKCLAQVGSYHLFFCWQKSMQCCLMGLAFEQVLLQAESIVIIDDKQYDSVSCLSQDCTQHFCFCWRGVNALLAGVNVVLVGASAMMVGVNAVLAGVNVVLVGVNASRQGSMQC